MKKQMVWIAWAVAIGMALAACSSSQADPQQPAPSEETKLPSSAGGPPVQVEEQLPGSGALPQEEVLPSVPARAADTSGWTAAVRDGKYGFVNPQDQAVIPFAYDEVGRFSEGLCPVYSEEKSRWGYIDTSGQLVIDYIFRQAGDFSNGLAPATSTGSLWGYIDPAGEWAVGCQYDQCGGYGDGVYVVQYQGYWGAITPEGETAVPFLYDKVLPDQFADGRLAVCVNDAWGVVSPQGEYIRPLEKSSSVFYSRGDFFQLGDCIYNREGQLLRSGMAIWQVQEAPACCLVYDEEAGTAEVIDPSGSTLVDLVKLAQETLPAVSGEISVSLVSQYERDLIYGSAAMAPYGPADGSSQTQWEGWMLLQAKDAGLARLEGSRSLYMNLVNLEGELFWEDWLVKNYQREPRDRLTVELYRTFAAVTDSQSGSTEVWDLRAGGHHLLEGVRFSNAILWGDYLITPCVTANMAGRPAGYMTWRRLPPSLKRPKPIP